MVKPTNLNIGDYGKTLELFHNETDRGAAVIAGSFLENYLAVYLRSYMIQDKNIDKLFDGFGPFSTYSQRIDTAYALGFIQEQEKDDLNYIQKIRNHFAHHPFETNFDKPPVCDWCLHLSTKDIYPSRGQEVNLVQDNRHRYLMAISLCIGSWHNSMLKRNKIPQILTKTRL